MNKREQYKTLLVDLPDVITLPEFLELLGGWGETQVLQLIKKGDIKSIKSPTRGHPHIFPKAYILDFLCSDIYKKEQAKRNDIKKRCKQ